MIADSLYFALRAINKLYAQGDSRLQMELDLFNNKLKPFGLWCGLVESPYPDKSGCENEYAVMVLSEQEVG